MIRCVFALLITLGASQAATSVQPAWLGSLKLTKQDAILVVNQQGQALFEWQADTPLIPASLTKLITTRLALEKWGAEHHFHTDFFILGRTLWIKGYGDPFLISEELERLAAGLLQTGLLRDQIDTIAIDNRYFDVTDTPGRTAVDDPYNAPLSAVAANFNTANLKFVRGQVVSAEQQTPLTTTAERLATNISSQATRINLVNDDNAQQHFAELVLAKLGWKTLPVMINQQLPQGAKRIYRHRNSHTLADLLRGALLYSNNFIANQLYLKLAEQEATEVVGFDMANRYVSDRLGRDVIWSGAYIEDGSGLSRRNRLSAKQIDHELQLLTPYHGLFDLVSVDGSTARVYAKTGTLDGVQTYAGMIYINERQYRFVFMFNRIMPYRLRDRLLARLVNDLEHNKPKLSATHSPQADG